MPSMAAPYLNACGSVGIRPACQLSGFGKTKRHWAERPGRRARRDMLTSMTKGVVLAIGACMAAHMAHGQTVAFNRDIRPIFSDRCYTCHGPSQTTRQSKLRLDIEPPVSARGEIVRRIALGDKPGHMPAAGPPLTEREIGLIKDWVDQGAVWEKHWSFNPPKQPAVPQGVNPIDYFIRARVEREGLRPSKEAGKPTLIRRVSLDLTGLPPTPAEIDAFLQDASPNAYEKVADRLLASPRYGERMAARWLDAARYADTNGYQTDGERYM